jgi:hypothetical protein
VVDSADPQETVRSYVAIYLREEVQTEGLVRSIGGFSRFLISPRMLHGLLAFKEDFPEASTLLLHRGRERLLGFA